MDRFNRSWKDHGRGFKPEDYVPLSKRSDWDGAVIVLPSTPEDEKKPVGRIQGKQKRKARRKWQR